MTIYLLNCHGQNTVEVTTAEAGRTIACPCGKQVLVPTLREIHRLPRKPEAQADSAPLWSVPQGVLFSMGLVLLAGGLVYIGFLIYQRSQLDTQEIVIKQEDWDSLDTGIMTLTPAKTLEVWEKYSHPLPEERPPPQFEINRTAARMITLKITVGGVLAACGLALMAAAMTIKPRPARLPKEAGKRPISKPR